MLKGQNLLERLLQKIELDFKPLLVYFGKRICLFDMHLVYAGGFDVS